LSPGAGRRGARQSRSCADPLEAGIIREIFEAYTFQGLGVRAIAKRLNDRGVPPPASLRRRGVAAWPKGTIWTIVRNPIYVGRLVFGKARYREVGQKRGKLRLPESEHVLLDNAAPAIIATERWEAAQAVHGTRRFASGRPWHRPYLLSGLIECAHCGKRFQAHRQQRGRVPAYYVCGGYVASGSGFCSSPRVPTTYLEEAVLDGIQKRLDRVLEPAELKRRLEAVLSAEDRGEDGVIPELETQLRETERRLARLVDVLADGAEHLPTVRARVVSLERDRLRLGRELDQARARSERGTRRTDVIAEALVNSLADVRRVLDGGGPEERKAVVRGFLQGIRIEAAKRRATLRWYRLPQPLSVKLVAVGGIEPPTRGL
jgi:site-specific DNA recombinase